MSLALGIGANATIFQLVDAIRLKTLPVEKPQELVSIDFEEGSTRAGAWYGRSAVLTYGQWDEIRKTRQAFSGVMAWSADGFNLAKGGEPRYAEGLYVSGVSFAFSELTRHSAVHSARKTTDSCARFGGAYASGSV